MRMPKLRFPLRVALVVASVAAASALTLNHRAPMFPPFAASVRPHNLEFMMARPLFAFPVARARGDISLRGYPSPTDGSKDRPQPFLLGTKELTPSQVKVLSMKNPGAKSRMKLYDLKGDGVIYPPEFKEWVDNAVSRVTARTTADEVILPYEDEASWLWRQFRDTVLEVSWQVVLASMTLGVVTVLVLHAKTGTAYLEVPDAKNETVQLLMAVQVMWAYMLTLSTFILTFFLKECYDYWGTAMDLSRKIQGRIMDLNLLVSSYAERDEDGELTPEGVSLVQSTARNTRLLQIMFWATFENSLACLHSDQALRRLADEGLLTPKELAQLIQPNAVGPNGRANQVLTWIMSRTARAELNGHVMSRTGGFERTFTDKCCTLRASYASMYDERDGKMPLAYVHVVQILIDSLLILTPIAVYPTTGIVCVPLAGVMTFFYHGLQELSKSFLDPFGNRGSQAQNMQVDVFIAETNNGVLDLADYTQMPFDWRDLTIQGEWGEFNQPSSRAGAVSDDQGSGLNAKANNVSLQRKHCVQYRQASSGEAQSAVQASSGETLCAVQTESAQSQRDDTPTDTKASEGGIITEE